MKNKTKAPIENAAYGGENWSPRVAAHRQEIGNLWGMCGVDTEWAPLRKVLLHAPGPEIGEISDPESASMIDIPDPDLAHEQHESITRAYQDAGVAVYTVDPDTTPPPNLMFCADLFFMTPEGAILARPASTVRAGEERLIARRLAEIGIPILRTLRGKATFEGADAAWINPQTVLLARGLRTNGEGVAQVTSTLVEMGVEVLCVDLPYGTMHLMGQLRFLDGETAVAWPGRVPYAAVQALRERGYNVLFIPDEGEAANGFALNFVTLAPRHILMSAANPVTQAFYESNGITCTTVAINELLKAAGGVGCLTGVLEREG